MQIIRCSLWFRTLQRYDFHLPGYIRECAELPSSGIFRFAVNSVNIKQRDVKLLTEVDRCRQPNIISFKTRRWVSELCFLSGLETTVCYNSLSIFRCTYEDRVTHLACSG